MDNNVFSLFDVFQGKRIDKVQEDFCEKYRIDMSDWEITVGDLEELFKYSLQFMYDSSYNNLDIKIGETHITEKYLYLLMRYDLYITIWLYSKYKDLGETKSLHDYSELQDYSNTKKAMKIFYNTHLKEIFDISFGQSEGNDRKQYFVPSNYIDFILFILSNIKHCPIYKTNQPSSMDFKLYQKYDNEFPNLAYRAFYERLFGFKLLSLICSELTIRTETSLNSYSSKLILNIMENLIESPCTCCKLSITEAFLNARDMNPMEWYINFAGLLEFTTRLFEIWETIVLCKLPLSSDNISKMEIILNNRSLIDLKPRLLSRSDQTTYKLLRNEYYTLFSKCPKTNQKFLQGRSGWKNPVFNSDAFFFNLLY